MIYLLDTNICIYLIKKKPESVLKKLMQKRISAVGVSSITLSELEYGVEKSSQGERNKLAIAEFMAPLTVFPYDDRVASTYGQIRVFLEKKGITIGPLDMLIGAHALSLQAVLVTNNDREFKRIPHLKVENWT
jgi:tRNA(fMet)-specific endonuclease VapC